MLFPPFGKASLEISIKTILKMSDCFVGIDVGSSSVRAVVIDTDGDIKGTIVEPIEIHNPKADFYEQSSEQIWQAVCLTIRNVLKTNKIDNKRIKGIGFDATCSLVVLDDKGHCVALFANGCIKAMKVVGNGTLPFSKSLVKKNDLSSPVIGLPELCENGCEKIGPVVNKPGTPIGAGLCHKAAQETGLIVGTPVGTGIIDAHAGCIGIMHTKFVSDNENLLNTSLSAKLGMICGTSTCHMALSERPLFINGIWGPYFETIWPGLWGNEAGQSAVGPVLEAVLNNYGNFLGESVNRYDQVQAKLSEYEATLGHLATVNLTKDLHVWPDYHGNRSPLADPSITGAIVGLKLTTDNDKMPYLVKIYLAHVQAMALMTRYVVESMVKNGHHFRAIYMCGGLQKNGAYVQAHADVLQLPVIVPDDQEPVARGAAILGAFASGIFSTLDMAAKKLSPNGRVVKPDNETKQYYDRKYEIFRQIGEVMMKIK